MCNTELQRAEVGVALTICIYAYILDMEIGNSDTARINCCIFNIFILKKVVAERKDLDFHFGLIVK